MFFIKNKKKLRKILGGARVRTHENKYFIVILFSYYLIFKENFYII